VWYAQPSVTLFALWIWHLFFVQAWQATQSILVLVVVYQCWQLLSKLKAYLQFVGGVAAVQQVLSYSWHVSLWSLHVKLRTAGLQENVAVENFEVEEMKEQFLRPFPCTETSSGRSPFCHFCRCNPYVDCNPPQWPASGCFHSRHRRYLLLVYHEYLSALANYCCHVVCFLLGDSLSSEISDAGESPKRKRTTFTTQRKFEIKITVVMSQFVLSLMSRYFIFIVLLLKSSGIPLQFGLTVPQQFIFCSVISSGEEKLSIYNFWRHPSTLIICFTEVWVTVLFVVAHFLSFAKYTSMSNV